MRPTHTAFALAGALTVLNVTHPALDDGLVLGAVTMSTVMLPDTLEGPRPKRKRKGAAPRRRLIPHRGLTHRWWFGILLVALTAAGAVYAAGRYPLLAPYAQYIPWIATGLAVGYGMHLFADLLTRDGLPKRKQRGQKRAPRFHLLPKWLRPRTGTISELPFRLAAVCACVLLAYALLPGTVRVAVHHAVTHAQAGQR
jgi:hypothetical protein